MSMKVDAGEISRADLLSVFPENIIVVDTENGRAAPQSEDEIKALAKSIFDFGQLEPVVVRRLPDSKKLQLVAGYGRVRAVKYINANLSPSQPFKVQCKVIECSPEEAFVRNIVENNERSATTFIDDAHNQRRLREQFGWPEAKIAEFYKNSVAYIGQLRKTLSLPTEIQQEASKGNLAVGAALDLAALPPEQAVAVAQEAKNPETGKIKTEVVRKKVRAHKQAKGEKAARTLREVRRFFEETTGPAETEAVRGLAKKMLDFISGKITDVQMTNALNKYCKADPTPEVPAATEVKEAVAQAS